MELYQYIYYLLFASLFFEFFNIKIKKIVLLCWVIFFIVFAGIRWGVGPDWDQYYLHFNNSEWTNIFSYERNDYGKLEPGFVFVNVLLKTLFGEFWIYNLIISAFLQITHYKFCCTFCPKHPLFLYIFLMIVGGGSFIVRAGLSIAVCYWAYYAIMKRKPYQFLVIVFIASMIHYQCVFLLPAYWIGKINIKYLYALLLFAAFVTIGYVFSDLFRLLMMSLGNVAEKAVSYTENQTEGVSGFQFTSILSNMFFLSAFYWYISHSKNANKDVLSTLINLFLIQIGVYSVFSSSEGMADLTRLTSLFFPAEVILVGYSLDYYLAKERILLRYVYLTIIAAYLLIKIPSLTSSYFFEISFIPYQTIFD